jgi:hypothetical protein
MSRPTIGDVIREHWEHIYDSRSARGTEAREKISDVRDQLLGMGFTHWQQMRVFSKALRQPLSRAEFDEGMRETRGLPLPDHFFQPPPRGHRAKRFFGVKSPAQGLKVIKHPDITANWEKSLRWKPTQRTAVLLPCAATKPFPDAPSHKAGYLEAIGNKKVDLFVVSEPLGIIPYSWSRKWPNDAYDFPPEHLRGAAFDLLAQRMGKWFDRVGKKYDKIYLALPAHHSRLIKAAIGDRKVPTVDVGIGACLKSNKCATGEYRSTTHAYRGFLKGRLRT